MGCANLLFVYLALLYFYWDWPYQWRHTKWRRPAVVSQAVWPPLILTFPLPMKTAMVLWVLLSKSVNYVVGRKGHFTARTAFTKEISTLQNPVAVRGMAQHLWVCLHFASHSVRICQTLGATFCVIGACTSVYIHVTRIIWADFYHHNHILSVPNW